MAATTALELGINISGLDAVLIAGLAGDLVLALAAGGPGGPGRAAPPRRCSSPATTRSTATWCTIRTRCCGHPVEPAVLDPANPYVLGPHLAAAAAELPLTGPDLELFGPAAAGGGGRPDGRGRAPQAAGRLVLRQAPAARPGRSRSAATWAGRCGWSRRRPGG